MTGQSVVKHFLTEGDKFPVSRLSPLEDQGGYAIASNYGALNPSIITARSPLSSQPCVLSIFCLDLLMYESGLWLTWVVRLVGGAYRLPTYRGDLEALLLQAAIFVPEGKEMER